MFKVASRWVNSMYAASIAGFIVSYLYEYPAQRTSTRLLCFIGLLAAVLIARLVRSIREKHLIFERGNVPALEDTSIISGNLYQTMANPDNVVRIDNLHKKLGKTFGFFYGPDPWIMTTDADLVKRIFITEGSTHVDITQYRTPFATEINKSVAQVRGDEWRKQRRMLAPAFSKKQMQSDNVFETINQIDDSFIDYIEQLHARGDKEVDMMFGAKLYALEVIFRVAFGTEYNNTFSLKTLKAGIVKQIEECCELLANRFIFIFIMLPTSSVIETVASFLAKYCSPVGSFIRSTHKILDESLHKRRSLLADKTRPLERKLIDSLIENFDRGNVANDVFKANLFFSLAAGHETTANTMAIMLWLLAKHDQIQDKLRQSIITEGPESKYLDWCVSETLRLYPAVPTAIGRILAHDISHNGQTYFKDSTVVVSTYSIHRSTELWGPDVEVFRPERWQEQDQLELSDAKRLRYFAFGAGPRRCTGERLALEEIKSFASKILVRYNISLDEKYKRASKLDWISPNMVHAIVKSPIKLKLEKLAFNK